MKQRREKSSGEDRTGLGRQIAERWKGSPSFTVTAIGMDKPRRSTRRRLRFGEKDVGQDDPGTIATTKAYVGVLRKLKRDAEAEELEALLERMSK